MVQNKIVKPVVMADLVWMVDDRVMEVLERNQPYWILNSRKRTAELQGNYRNGVLKTISPRMKVYLGLSY